MTAPSPTEITAAARKFVEETTMKTLLGIPDEALDAVMAVGFQLYQAGRYPEAEVLCRGLIAADHKYWWSYSLYAATLRRVGRLDDALAQLETGLHHSPGEPQLLYMHREVTEAIAGGEASVSARQQKKSSAPEPQAAA
jgi:tetratricopeptide (TPR) repeat protein